MMKVDFQNQNYISEKTNNLRLIDDSLEQEYKEKFLNWKEI